MSDEIKNPNTEEDQPDLMTLEDEDGNEITFEVIDALIHRRGLDVETLIFRPLAACGQQQGRCGKQRGKAQAFFHGIFHGFRFSVG